jgi:hypothetical protein
MSADPSIGNSPAVRVQEWLRGVSAELDHLIWRPDARQQVVDTLSARLVGCLLGEVDGSNNIA